MLEGLYVGAAGMNAQQDRIDAIANDLANVNTTGYKQERVSFSDLLYSSLGDHRGTTLRDQIGAGVRVANLQRDFSQGALNQTGQPLDCGILGEGFFQVRTATGQIGLTRDGSFQLDGQGRLTLSTGELITPAVTVPVGTDPSAIHIGSDGTVLVNGQTRGKVLIVNVAAPDKLASLGNNLYGVTAQSGAPQPVAKPEVAQGTLEQSNADVGNAFSEMIESQRAFDLNARVIRTQDDLWTTANQIRR